MVICFTVVYEHIAFHIDAGESCARSRVTPFFPKAVPKPNVFRPTYFPLDAAPERNPHPRAIATGDDADADAARGGRIDREDGERGGVRRRWRASTRINHHETTTC